MRNLDGAADRQSAIGLAGLSERQQRLVEQHIDLVRFAVARSGGRRCAQRHDMEYTDLMQEGSMALMEAVRAHDPARHGAFEPYAISRINFAVSRYAHEHGGLVRVPFVTQRRVRAQDRRLQEADASASGAAANRLPRVLCAEGIDHRGFSRRRAAQEASERSAERMTVADAAGPRIAGVLAGVRDRLLGASGRSPRREEIIRRCFDERWTIPEADARTPIRQLARELGCSLGGITHCEARFEREAAAAIERDPVLVQLRRMAKSSPYGFGHRLSDEELVQLQPLFTGEQGDVPDRRSRRERARSEPIDAIQKSEKHAPARPAGRGRAEPDTRSAKHAPSSAKGVSGGAHRPIETRHMRKIARFTDSLSA